MTEPLRVLFVEDSREDVLILLDQLRQGGYEPHYTRVETALAMREVLHNDTWDLILADHAMPQFSGPEAVQVLKESGQDIPLIIVSGTVTEEEAIELMREGAHDFVLKQKLSRLLPAIRRELREAQNRWERREALKRLDQERAMLSSAIELLPFPIIFNTLDGEVMRANRASYDFFGDLSAASWWERQLLAAPTQHPVPPDEWPMMRAARGEVVPPTEGILVLSNNRRVDVLAVAAPVFTRGEIIATVVAFMDITPIKEADRAKTRFLSVLSHELRTPLTSILGWAQLAQESSEVAPDALRIIVRNASVQHRMLENLLEISRWLYGKFDLHREPLELWPAVESAVAAYAARAAERQIALTLHPPPTALPISGDHKRLVTLFENLVDNALAFTDAGGHIDVWGERDAAQARVIVRDMGRGIPADMLPHIFDLFKVAPEIEQAGGGLGLGLPLAKVIVEAHGGSITADSPGAGQGSTIVVTVPLREGTR